MYRDGPKVGALGQARTGSGPDCICAREAEAPGGRLPWVAQLMARPAATPRGPWARRADQPVWSPRTSSCGVRDVCTWGHRSQASRVGEDQGGQVGTQRAPPDDPHEHELELSEKQFSEACNSL